MANSLTNKVIPKADLLNTVNEFMEDNKERFNRARTRKGKRTANATYQFFNSVKHHLENTSKGKEELS